MCVNFSYNRYTPISAPRGEGLGDLYAPKYNKMPPIPRSKVACGRSVINIWNYRSLCMWDHRGIVIIYLPSIGIWGHRGINIWDHRIIDIWD